MTPERSARVPQARARAGLWRLLSALGVGAVLAGCASSTLRVVVDGRPQHASPATPAAPQVRAWHIAQMRTEDGAAFRVVANEPPPTPKTLASGGAPIAPTATAAPGPSASRVEGPARPPRATRHARVRTPVGTVHFAPGAARVHAAAQGRTFVSPDDIKDLAVPVLAHRVLLATESQLRGVTAADAVADLLRTTPVPG